MRAAVIGAGSESLHTIHKAQELGQEVIALDGNSRAVGLTAADKGIHVDIADERQTIEVLRREKIDYLLTPPIGRVLTSVGAANDALKLPGISKETARLCTDKYEFHQILSENNLRKGYCYLVGKEEGTLSYPAILKPRFGSGSRSVFYVSDKKETEQALIAVNYGGNDGEDYVLEEVAPGIEYGVDGAVDGNQLQVVLLRRKLLTQPPARQAVGYLTVTPETEVRLIRQVQEYLSRVGTALGLRDCLFHADLMIQRDKIFVIELSARPSGHYLHDVFTPLAAGTDLAEEYIKCRIGMPYSYQPKKIRKMLIRYFDLSGRIMTVPTESIVREILLKSTNRLIRWQCHIASEDCLESVTAGHSLMKRGYFILEGNTEDELRAGGEAVLDLFVTVSR